MVTMCGKFYPQYDQDKRTQDRAMLILQGGGICIQVIDHSGPCVFAPLVRLAHVIADLRDWEKELSLAPIPALIKIEKRRKKAA